MEKSLDVAVVGTGYVGLITGVLFADMGHNVICADVDKNKINALQNGDLPIYEEGLDAIFQEVHADGRISFTTSTARAVQECTVIFIAVGTPSTPSGAPDLSGVAAAARDIANNLDDYRVIVEKSTVPVQTGEQVKTTIERYADTDVNFDVVSNPEFLAEGSALQDARNPDRIVLGVNSDRAEKIMRDLYQPIDAPMIVTDLSSAELIKHASNSFLAMKISYINAISRICDLSGANVDEVAKGMGMDARIADSFLNAGVGYGGSCFPKDVDAFYRISEDLGYSFDLLKEVQRINREQRKRLMKYIEKELWVLSDKKIGILGLSFKPGTDDIRRAPSIYLIEELLDRGCQVSAYDPKAIDNVRDKFGSKITYGESTEQIAEDADCLVLLTEWEEFQSLDFDHLKQKMVHPIFIDGRNIYDPEKMEQKGWTYRSVGRPVIQNE